MGTTRTLADGEAFVRGRSKETAERLVDAAKELDLKGSVKTTYDGYRAPVEVVNAAGFGSESSEESSTPENPAEQGQGQGQDENPEGKLFDPSEATVDEVKEYLDGADEAERARVIAAEKESDKPRKGVLDLAVTEEAN